ncbi:MAG: Rrf2 family transcriptional regulator [Bacteroidetes bacterium]|nr:Rrf2 family transcriptional regulator [Bacteroidota bacterium]
MDDFCKMLKDSGRFDDLEIKIIRGLFKLKAKKNDQVTASVIAKQAKISVTNAYKYLYALESKGIVESNKEKNKVFWLSKSSNPFT